MSKDYLDKWEERAKQNTEIIEQQQAKTKMSKEEEYTYDEIFLIYYNDGCGDTDLIAVTNDLEKWIENHNEERWNEVACGEEEEEEHISKECSCFEGLEDFDIVEEGLINFKTKRK